MLPKVEFAGPAKVVDLPRVGPRVSSGHDNETKLLCKFRMGRNKPIFCAIGAGVVKQDMGSVRAGLLYGLEKTEIHAYLTGRHGQSEMRVFTRMDWWTRLEGKSRVSLQCSAGLNGVGRAADSLSSK